MLMLLLRPEVLQILLPTELVMSWLLLLLKVLLFLLEGLLFLQV